MSISFSKRRTSSVVPAVNLFNNWLENQQKKVSTIIKTRASRTISTSMCRSNLINDPQLIINTNKNNSKFYHVGVLGSRKSQHGRTYSSYRNTQSRLGVTKDELKQMSEQIAYLVENLQKSRLDIRMTQKQFLIDMQRKQQQLKQQIFSLKKIVTYSINEQQQRKNRIKTEVNKIQQNYTQMKQKLQFIDEKITSIENSCGFMTFGNKLYK